MNATSRVNSIIVRPPLAPSLPRRGFSLIEVLLAVFILGVGIISIAALFPAGIAQQRRSTDEMMGPIVAEAAIEIIRRKVRADDFGTLEEFTPNLPDPLAYISPTVPGDWPWLRPGIVLEDDPATTGIDERGMLDVFSRAATRVAVSLPEPALQRGTEFPAGFPDPAAATLFGIPYNTLHYDFDTTTPNPEPGFIIAQQDRYYPLGSQLTPVGQRPPQPQYVWDCMFRRFQGRMLVAIFVYRVSAPGGITAGPYVVPGSPQPPIAPTQAIIPPLPIALDLVVDPATGAAPPPYCIGGAWDNFGLTFISLPGGLLTREDDRFVLGTQGGDDLNLQDVRLAWQAPGQWLVDQNNVIHRVVSTERAVIGDPVRVELLQPPPAYIPLNGPDIKDVFFYDPAPTTAPVGVENVVSQIWYIPTYLAPPTGPSAGAGTDYILTPVYATVREL